MAKIIKISRVFETSGILATVIGNDVYCITEIPTEKIKSWKWAIFEHKKILFACIAKQPAAQKIKIALPEFQTKTAHYSNLFCPPQK